MLDRSLGLVDKIKAIFGLINKPAPVPTPVDPANPAPLVIPPDHPLLDALAKLLPLLSKLIPLIPFGATVGPNGEQLPGKDAKPLLIQSANGWHLINPKPEGGYELKDLAHPPFAEIVV